MGQRGITDLLHTRPDATTLTVSIPDAPGVNVPVARSSCPGFPINQAAN